MTRGLCSQQATSKHILMQRSIVACACVVFHCAELFSYHADSATCCLVHAPQLDISMHMNLKAQDSSFCPLASAMRGAPLNWRLLSGLNVKWSLPLVPDS